MSGSCKVKLLQNCKEAMTMKLAHKYCACILTAALISTSVPICLKAITSQIVNQKTVYVRVTKNDKISSMPIISRYLPTFSYSDIAVKCK